MKKIKTVVVEDEQKIWNLCFILLKNIVQHLKL